MTTSPLDALAKPPPAPSELDELMMRDPLDLSAQDIDAIIAYQRQARARRETPTGKGRSRGLTDAPGGKIDLAALGLTAKPAAPTTITPAQPGSFRRL